MNGGGPRSDYNGVMRHFVFVALLLVTSAARAEDPLARTRIGFDGINVDTEAANHLDAWTSTYRGDQHEPLEGEAFYYEVCRPDLAEGFRSRAMLRKGLALVGGAIVLASLIPLVVGDHNEALVDETVTRSIDGHYVQVTDKVSNGALVDGAIQMGVVAGVGVMVLLIAYGLDSQPIDAVQAHDLAARRNRELRARIASAIHVAPTVTPHGGALQLSGAF